MVPKGGCPAAAEPKLQFNRLIGAAQGVGYGAVGGLATSHGVQERQAVHDGRQKGSLWHPVCLPANVQPLRRLGEEPVRDPSPRLIP